MVECIAEYLGTHDHFTQQQVTDHIRRTLRISVSRPTVCRWLQRMKGRSVVSSLVRARGAYYSPDLSTQLALQLETAVAISPVGAGLYDDALELSQFLHQGELPLFAGLQAS